jgi:hypothetical protein
VSHESCHHAPTPGFSGRRLRKDRSKIDACCAVRVQRVRRWHSSCAAIAQRPRGPIAPFHTGSRRGELDRGHGCPARLHEAPPRRGESPLVGQLGLTTRSATGWGIRAAGRASYPSPIAYRAARAEVVEASYRLLQLRSAASLQARREIAGSVPRPRKLRRAVLVPSALCALPRPRSSKTTSSTETRKTGVGCGAGMTVPL